MSTIALQSAGISGAQAPGVSSLVYGKNNRNNQEVKAKPRGRWCGRWTARGQDQRRHPGRHERFARVYCKTWDCGYCGPQKARQYKAAVRSTAESWGLNRFLTLTLDPKKLPPGCPTKYIRDVFAKFRVYLQRRYGKGKNNYVCVLEFQKNGLPHLHILLDRYIEQKWVSEVWQTLGGGHRVDIRWVNVTKVSRYLSKYLTKEMLLSAPKRARRVTTSRSIKLMPKMQGPKMYAWHVRRMPIEYFMAVVADTVWGQLSILDGVVEVVLDDEEYLKGFVVPN